MVTAENDFGIKTDDKTILIVDDNIEVRQATTQVLAHFGFKTIDASDGKTAIVLAKQHLPDLILCDVMMPGMDGFAVLKELQKDITTSIIPFVFITSRTDIRDRRVAMELGADDYLMKPFGADQLRAVVGARLKKQQKHKQYHETTLKVLRQNIAYALPHEFRTPLMIVLGYADMMRAPNQELPAEAVQQMSEEIFLAGRRLHRLAENYIILSQVEMLATDPHQLEALNDNEVENPSYIIQVAAEKAASSYDRLVDVRLGSERTTVRITYENLTKIIEELVDNACKFSEPGTTITVTTSCQDNQFVIRIADRGKGLTPEQVTRMGEYMQFDRYLQEQQGVGLGFTLARRLIQLHRGTISIESKMGEGTTVIIQFPLKTKPC